MRLPVGSIVLVETNELGDHKFAFGRLSAFCFAEPQAARREFAAMFQGEYLLNEPGRANYDQALVIFNQSVGRQFTGSIHSAIHQYSKTKGKTEAYAARELLLEANEAIKADQVARHLLVTDREAETLAESASYNVQGRPKARSSSYPYPINARAVAHAKRLYANRLTTARTFGQPAIERARALIDARKGLEKIATGQ